MGIYYLIFVGVTAFSILEKLLPEGKMKKTMRHAAGLTLTVYLLFPIKNLIKKGLFSGFDAENITIQTDFLDKTFLKQVELDKYVLIEKLKNYGIEADYDAIYVEYETENKIIYKKVVLNLKNCVINKDNPHIDKLEIEKTINSVFTGAETEITCDE